MNTKIRWKMFALLCVSNLNENIIITRAENRSIVRFALFSQDFLLLLLSLLKMTKNFRILHIKAIDIFSIKVITYQRDTLSLIKKTQKAKHSPKICQNA